MKTPVQSGVSTGTTAPNLPTRSTLNSVHTAWQHTALGWKVGAVVAASIALTLVCIGRSPVASALACTVLIGASLVDLYERRLPNSLVLFAAIAGAFALSVEIIVADRELLNSLYGVAAGTVVFAGPILVFHLVSPRSMGFGDVKAAVVLGAAIGVAEWQLALAGLALAAGLTATAGIAYRARTVAFGPGLVAGALLALLAQPMIVPTIDHDAIPVALVTAPHEGTQA